jgi:pimeloyl-ACP methyl ester carboxylesterase
MAPNAPIAAEGRWRDLAWCRYGADAGHPVLAWHGTPAVGRMYELAGPAAARHGLTLIAPDRPGYGASPPRAEAEQSFLRMAEDGVALMRAIGCERFSVLGVSGGGPYAAVTAAAHPDRVAALALVSPVGLIAEPGPNVALPRAARFSFQVLPTWRRTLAVAARWGLRHYSRYPDRTYRALVATAPPADRVILRRPEIAHFQLTMTEEALRQGPTAALADQARFGRPWGIDPARVRCPAVLWQGTNDRLVPPAAAFALGARIPGCRVHRLEGAGHFWIFEHADDVIAELAALARGVHDPSEQRHRDGRA